MRSNFAVLDAGIVSKAQISIKKLKDKDVKILKRKISKDHVHIFASVPPDISISDLIESDKASGSRKMFMEFKRLRRKFWGRPLWARGYFAASSGNVTDGVIMQYIEQQGHEPPDTDFKIER